MSEHRETRNKGRLPRWTSPLHVLTAFLLMSLCLFGPASALGAEPHNDVMINSNIKCSACHETMTFRSISTAFRDSTDDLCLGCHESEDMDFSHPVGIEAGPSFPPDIPLSSTGKIMCITCHTFHSSYYLPIFKKRVYLRKRALTKEFCLECHRKTLPVRIGISH